MKFTKTRTRGGDLSLPFFGFILTAAISIAAITGISQFNIMSHKLNIALEEGRQAAINYVKENISDSALVGTISSTTQNELNNAKTTGIIAANNTLGTTVYNILSERNSSMNIFDNTNTFVTASGNGKVEIQFGVDAQLLANIPIRYKRKTSLISVRPSELSQSVCAELSCSGTCGECGVCDECSGKCVPKFDVPDGDGGFKIPDTENAGADNIACLEDSDPCSVIGDGWQSFEENGFTGCQKDNCKVIPDQTYIYFSSGGGGFYYYGPSPGYNVVLNGLGVGNFNDDDPESCDTATGDLYTKGDETSAYYEATGYGGTVYPTYAVCTSEYTHDDERKIFVTAGTYSQLAFNGKAGADSLCQNAASSAGLAGSYMAFMNGGYTPLTDLIPKDTALRRVDGQLVNKCPLYKYANNLPINITQFGTTINGSIGGGACGPYDLFCFPQILGDEIRVWTGSQNNGSLANHCNYWFSTSGNDLGTTGHCTDTNFWLLGSFPFSGHVCGGALNGGSNRLYCIETN